MEKAKTTAEPPPKAPAKGQKLAVVLIRNTTGASGAVRDTLKMLRLHKKMACTILSKTATISGMLSKVKDYTTYGEIDDQTLKLLQEKRGTKGGEAKKNKEFHLHPPRGGFERKGIKRSYTQGGALGYRGSRINELLKKML